jgi:4'-phosphopantetheinyl transferase
MGSGASAAGLWAAPAADSAECGAGAVHVWRARVGELSPWLPRLAAVLDATERARVERYRMAEDKARFTIGRGLLRLLLCQPRRTDPREVTFAYAEHGKPELAPAAGAALGPKAFNVSHSGDIVLVALASGSGMALGVDVERVRELDDLGGIARRFFTAGEAEELLALPDGPKRVAAFFCTWTRKEAILKAHGAGISLGLDGVRVATGVGPEGPSLGEAGPVGRNGGCELHSLWPGDGYVGALAVRSAAGAPLPIAAWHVTAAWLERQVR